MLTQADIDYLRRTAAEYDALLERWKFASAGSQEIANLHATFKARAGAVGQMVEGGLFRRILATLDGGVAAPSATLPRELLQAARDNLRILAMHGPGVPALVAQLDAALAEGGER
jgi:hypothetical protein